MEKDKVNPDGLREIHRECLRLAAQLYSSKEIARKLRISRHTVDQRLRHATQQLGATSRYDAVRRYIELEGPLPLSVQCDPIAYDPSYLSADADDDSSWVSEGEGDQSVGTDAARLQDAQLPYNYGDASRIEALLSYSASSGKRADQSLSAGIKSLLAVAVAAVSLVAFGAAVAALEVLSRI